jgi:DNA replication protein DnaC
LLKAETAEQEVRSMASQLKARFPVYRAPARFDFSSSEINEALVRQLHRCVVEPVDNVVLVGGPGTGKTRIATSLGVQPAPDRRIPIGIWHLADVAARSLLMTGRLPVCARVVPRLPSPGARGPTDDHRRQPG